MKKSKIVVLLLSLALLMGGGISSVHTANNNLNFDKSVLKLNEETEAIYKTVLFGKDYNSEGVGSYTKSWSTTNDGFTCNIVNANNNGNAWSYIKMGRDSSTSVGTITTATPIDKVITSVDITIDAVTSSSINSLKLYVSSTADDYKNSNFCDITIEAGKQNVVIPDELKDANKYYIIEADCKKGSKNGLIQISKITFNISKSDSNPAVDAIENVTTKAQLKYSFDVTQEEGLASFEKVITEPTDWRGQYLIVYEAGNVVFDGSLTTLDAASNTQALTTSDNKIKATELKKYLFTVSPTDGGYKIQSSSGYYIGQTSNANGLESSESTAFTNKISCKSDGTIDIVSSGGAYLRYNTASNQNRFRYYKSSSYTGQKAICLYKLKNYSFFNMKMNLGAVIEAAKVQALVDAKLSISSYGVAVAQKEKLDVPSISAAVTNNKSYVSIVSKAFESVGAMKKTDANGTATSGDYVIFNADLSFPDESKYNVEVSAVAFFKLGDGTYVFFQERTLSVSSLAQAYIDNTDVYNTFDSNVRGSLKALAAIPASVA